MIVDEEQRFGVKQKELLRQLKLKVDVLSLSATPIPRTLQMSLAGLRDISVIETPPEGRRPVRTYVGPVRRGAGRRGRSSARPRARARSSSSTTGSTPCTRSPSGCAPSAPGVRFAEAHGQMDESELEETMLGFLRGDADCLVATTIIESGLDIPQANTLIVERADQLGLAQAYQIRGRVGRSRERAFAYMLYPSEEAISAEAGAAAGDPLRPHRARLGLRDRDARPRAARRRRPARRRAVGPRRGDRLRALRGAARRGGRAAARRGGAEGEDGAARGAGAARRRRRRLPARRVHPLRGGEDRRPPPDRRRPARRASCARCATSCATASARCRTRSRTCSRSQRRPDRARAAGRAHRRGPRRPAVDQPARARRGRRSARCASGSPRRCTSCAHRTLGLRVGDDPARRLESVALELTERADGGAEDESAPA